MNHPIGLVLSFPATKREIVLLRKWQCMVSFEYNIILCKSHYILRYPYVMIKCWYFYITVLCLWLRSTAGSDSSETQEVQLELKHWARCIHCSHALLLFNIACWMLNICSSTHLPPTKPNKIQNIGWNITFWYVIKS